MEVPKLMEQKWYVDQYKDTLIPFLGGLHIALNFVGVLGMCVLWVECDVLGANASQNVISGKGYARACENTNSHCRHFGNYYSHN